MEIPLKNTEPSLSALRRISYFQRIEVDSLKRLADSARTRSLNKGDILVAKGDSDIGGVYAVLSGQLHVSLPATDGGRSVQLLGPGTTLGETILLTRECSPCDTVATRKSQVLLIDGKRWLEELRNSHTMTFEVLQHLAQRRLKSIHMLAASSKPTDLARVAGYLMEHRPKLLSGTFSFALPARKMDIASLLHMTNASFSRCLCQLKRNHLIHVSGLHIHVLNAPLLARIADGLKVKLGCTSDIEPDESGFEYDIDTVNRAVPALA